MFKLASMVTTIESGKTIASGLTYELRIPFFLGAIHEGHEDLVKWMILNLHWPYNSQFNTALDTLCNELQPYDTDFINWIRDTMGRAKKVNPSCARRH